MLKKLITFLLELYTIEHPDVPGFILRGEEVVFKIKIGRLEDG